MSEKSVEQVAEEHAEWFVGIITPMLKSVAITFFIHGNKHGVVDEQQAVLRRLSQAGNDMVMDQAELIRKTLDKRKKK